MNLQVLREYLNSAEYSEVEIDDIIAHGTFEDLFEGFITKFTVDGDSVFIYSDLDNIYRIQMQIISDEVKIDTKYELGVIINNWIETAIDSIEEDLSYNHNVLLLYIQKLSNTPCEELELPSGYLIRERYDE